MLLTTCDVITTFQEEGIVIRMRRTHGETTWVIITKLLNTPQVTPLDEWDVREGDGTIKQKAA